MQSKEIPLTMSVGNTQNLEPRGQHGCRGPRNISSVNLLSTVLSSCRICYFSSSYGPESPAMVKAERHVFVSVKRRDISSRALAKSKSSAACNYWSHHPREIRIQRIDEDFVVIVMELWHILCRSRDFAILVGGSNFEERVRTLETWDISSWVP